MTKEILPKTNKQFIRSIKKSMNVTKNLDKQIINATKHLNKFIKPLANNSKLAQPFAEMKKQVEALNKAILANDFDGFNSTLANTASAFSDITIQSLQMIQSMNQAGKDYEMLSKVFQSGLIIDDSSLLALDDQTKNLIQSFSGIQAILTSLKSELSIDSSSFTLLATIGKQLRAEFSLMNQNMLALNNMFVSNQSTVSSFGSTMNATLSSVDTTINNLVAVSGRLGEALKDTVEEPVEETNALQEKFQQLKDSINTAFDSINSGRGQLKQFKDGFEQVNSYIDKGINPINNYAQTIIGRSKEMIESMSSFGASFLETGRHSTTATNLINGAFGGIGNTLKASADIGLTAMGTMIQGLTSVMGFALKAIAPTALLGAALAGFALMDQQLNGQISNMIQTAIVRGPEIIRNFAQGIISKLPDLIIAGTQLVAGLAEAIKVNFPVMIEQGIGMLSALIQGVIDNKDSLIDSALIIIETLATGLLTAIPKLLLMGLELLSALVDGIFSDPNKLVDTVTKIIESFTTNITNNLPQIVDKGIEILLKLAEGIASVLPELIPVALEAITTLVGTLLEQLPKLLDAAVKIVATLCKGLWDNLPEILSAAVKLLMTFNMGLLKLLPNVLTIGWKIINELFKVFTGVDLLEIGKNIISGLIDGIKGKIKDVIHSVEEIGKAIGDKFKSIFNIHSPSRWMRDEIGAMLPAGLAIGIERNAHVVDKPMDDLASKVMLPSLDSLNQEVDSIQTLSVQSNSTQTQTQQAVKQPATFNIQLGKQQFQAFVQDISEAMGQDSAIHLAF